MCHWLGQCAIPGRLQPAKHWQSRRHTFRTEIENSRPPAKIPRWRDPHSRTHRCEPDQPFHPVRSGTKSLVPRRHFALSPFSRAMVEVITNSLSQYRLGGRKPLQSFADVSVKPARADAKLPVFLPETCHQHNRSDRVFREKERDVPPHILRAAGRPFIRLRERNVHSNPLSKLRRTKTSIHDPCRINPGDPALRVGDQFDQCLLTTTTDNWLTGTFAMRRGRYGAAVQDRTARHPPNVRLELCCPATEQTVLAT